MKDFKSSQEYGWVGVLLSITSEMSGKWSVMRCRKRTESKDEGIFVYLYSAGKD